MSLLFQRVRHRVVEEEAGFYFIFLSVGYMFVFFSTV